MVTKRIAIRTDANSEIGTGHFMRCLTLAEELKKNNALVTFISRGLPAHLTQMLQDRRFDYYLLAEPTQIDTDDDLTHSEWLKVSQKQDATQTLFLLDKFIFDWVIVDHYAIDLRWHSLIRQATRKILVIDDLADRQHDCDVLLDQNFYRNMNQRYLEKVPKHCSQLLGPEYALLREEFRELQKLVRTRNGLIKNLLIFFGGIDSKNYTQMALEAIGELGWSIEVNVVIGQQHPDIEYLKKMTEIQGYKLHIQTSEMAKLMMEADLAIGAAGSASWERCCLGLPSLVVAVAENQLQAAIDLSSTGASIYLGNFSEVNKNEIVRALKEKVPIEKIRDCSMKSRQIVDPNGVYKVSKMIIGE